MRGGCVPVSFPGIRLSSRGVCSTTRTAKAGETFPGPAPTPKPAPAAKTE